jgi:hypothetical protein
LSNFDFSWSCSHPSLTVSILVPLISELVVCI